MLLLFSVELDLITSHVDLSRWSAANVDGPCFSRYQREIVVLQFQGEIVLIYSAVDPYVTGDLFGGNGEVFALNAVSKIRKGIGPQSHGNKEVVIVAHYIIQSLQLHSNEATIGKVGKLSLVELMQENSVERFDSLLEGVLDLGLLARKGDD